MFKTDGTVNTVLQPLTPHGLQPQAVELLDVAGYIERSTAQSNFIHPACFWPTQERFTDSNTLSLRSRVQDGAAGWKASVRAEPGRSALPRPLTFQNQAFPGARKGRFVAPGRDGRHGRHGATGWCDDCHGDSAFIQEMIM